MSDPTSSSPMYLLQFLDSNKPPGNDSCVNSWQGKCDMSVIDGFAIQSPELLPICAMAGYIGFTAGKQILQMKNTRGSFIYGLTFCMFGVMMLDAGWNDCILSRHGDPRSLAHLFFMVLDVGLTSCIGLNFSFCAMVDAGWIKEKSPFTLTTMGISYALLVGGWIFSVLNQWWGAFLYLYMYVIGISGAIFLVIEAFIFFQNGLKGIEWVTVAGIAGGLGLSAIFFPSLDLWLCHTLGCHFSGNFFWFLLTDVAMYSLWKYFIVRAEETREENGYHLIPMEQFLF